MIEQIAKVVNVPHGDPWAPIDASIYYDLETHDWRDAIKMQPPLQSPFDENFDVFWVHAIANARLGRPQEAASALKLFRNSSREWINRHGWGDVLHIALEEAEAWTLFAQGKQQQAIQTLTGAVEFEKNHPIYYADVLPRPSSEMLGDMLAEMGRPSEALDAYKVALQMAPNRRDSLQGAEMVAAECRQKRLAQKFAEQLALSGAEPVPAHKH